MIDIEIARQHLKADGDDDGLIAQYLLSATSICESYCNRKFYETIGAKDADATAAMAELEAAITARNLALDATDDGEVANIIVNKWIATRGGCLHRLNGVVIDATIDAAILAVLGRLYRVRQDVAAGQGAAAAQVPEGARRILEPYLWIGDLGGGS